MDIQISVLQSLQIGFVKWVKNGHPFSLNRLNHPRRDNLIHRHLNKPPVERLELNRLNTKRIGKRNRRSIIQIITKSLENSIFFGLDFENESRGFLAGNLVALFFICDLGCSGISGPHGEILGLFHLSCGPAVLI